MVYTLMEQSADGLQTDETMDRWSTYLEGWSIHTIVVYSDTGQLGAGQYVL